MGFLSFIQASIDEAIKVAKKKSFIAKFVFKLLNDQNRSKGESSINFDYYLGLVNSNNLGAFIVYITDV